MKPPDWLEITRHPSILPRFSFKLSATPFPIRLYEMLTTLGDDCDIISWQPHGRCFVVHKPVEFTRLLPQFFKLSKIASFQRQLNLYGFVRLTSGLDRGGYYHSKFLRGRSDLLWTIPRAKVKGTKVRAKSNPTAEPNFWGMEWVGLASKDSGNKITTCIQAREATSLNNERIPEKTRFTCPTSSIVSELSDDYQLSIDKEQKVEDFFDRLLHDMFDDENSYDFDSLLMRHNPAS